MADALRIERETRQFRLLALLFVVAGVYFQRSAIPLLPAVALALCYLVYLTLLIVFLIRHVSTRLLPYMMLAVDTAFVSGTLYLFGVESAFFVLMPILILYYAIYLGYAGSLVGATLVAFSYIGLAYLQEADLALIRLLPIQIPLFYLIAVFTGYLAEQRLREGRERQELALLLQAERGTRAVLDLAAGLANVLDLTALARHILLVAVKAADCSDGALMLVDAATGALERPIAFFPEQAPGDEGADSPAPSALERLALLSARVQELDGVESAAFPAWARSLGPGYVLVVPLIVEGVPQGVFTLVGKAGHACLGAPQQELIRDHAAFCALLLAKARAYAVTQKQSARLSGELRGAVQQMQRTQHRQKKDEVRVGRLLLGPGRGLARLGPQHLALSDREFDVLHLLARHAGRPVRHEVILREVWGEEDRPHSNVVDVAVNRLRRKLAAQAEADSLIETVRGVGYLLVTAQTTAAQPAGDGARGSTIKRTSQGQRGVLLLEHVISLAVIALVVPALLAAVTTLINATDSYRDRAITLELALSQMENVQQQTFQSSPASYPTVAAATGYTVTVATSAANSYTYPTGTGVAETLQLVTVTATGRHGSLVLQGHKVRQ